MSLQPSSDDNEQFKILSKHVSDDEEERIEGRVETPRISGKRELAARGNGDSMQIINTANYWY